MRLLANENLPADAVMALREAGHDVAWMRLDAPGSSDLQVLRRAQLEARLLLTFDKNFGELAFRAGLPASSGVVLFRISAPSSAQVARIVVAALGSRHDWSGHFSVIEDLRIRMTPLPSSQNTSLPRTYAAAVERLLADLTPEGREALRDFPESELARGHSGLAMRLRRDYGLREGNPQLLRSCAEQAGRVVDGQVVDYDADEAANLIVRAAWERLRAGTS